MCSFCVSPATYTLFPSSPRTVFHVARFWGWVGGGGDLTSFKLIYSKCDLFFTLPRRMCDIFLYYIIIIHIHIYGETLYVAPLTSPYSPLPMIPVLFYSFLFFFTVVLFRSRKYRVDVDRKKKKTKQ